MRSGPKRFKHSNRFIWMFLSFRKTLSIPRALSSFLSIPAASRLYQIIEGVAWDFLQRSDGWTNLARRADAVCFGSLAQRSAVSRETILDFLRHLRPDALRVFDVNLRQQFLRARYWIIQPDQPTS